MSQWSPTLSYDKCIDEVKHGAECVLSCITVNVVIGGKFCGDVVETLNMGVIFTIFQLCPELSLSVLFSLGGDFREEGHSAKKRKNYHHTKSATFTVL